MKRALARTLREWLRLLGLGLAHGEPRVGYPPASLTILDSQQKETGK